MSDTIPVIDPVAEKRTAQRREALAKGRAAKVIKQQQAARTAAPRSAADAADVGIAAHPGPAKRASHARESGEPEVLRRVRREDRDANWANLPEQDKRPGWDYEWKVLRVYNEPVDVSIRQMERNAGWRPEKAVNWPSLVEPGTPDDAAVESNGQRLYGRPMSLTVEAKQEDMQAAIQQQREKTMAAAQGQSAHRGEESMARRGVRPVPLEISVVGEAG